MRRPLLAAVAGTLLLAPVAGRSEVEPPSWYLGFLTGYVDPDTIRDADYGVNGHAVLGFKFSRATGIELNGFAQQTTRESDRGENFSYGGGLDFAFGVTAPGHLLFLLGGGAIYEDFLAVSQVTSGYANGGLGAYLPFSIGGELWRFEARYNVVFNDETFAPVKRLEDVRFNLGIVLGAPGEDLRAQADRDADGIPDTQDKCPDTPAGERVDPIGCSADTDLDGVPDSVDQCPDTPAGTAVDGAGCRAGPDADGDGVPDAQDRCAETPRWVKAGPDGCVPDSDGDGVDETLDCCPGTPAGAPVDGKGCPPTVDADADKDGVPNEQDACPHTPAGAEIDGRGCVKVEKVVLRPVHFELESYALKPETYRLLNGVAATLQAGAGRVEIGGHTDDTGSDTYNQRLSRERAEVVRDFLIYLGIPAQRLTAVGYGESRPLATNKTEEGRARNRRVELKPLP